MLTEITARLLLKLESLTGEHVEYLIKAKVVTAIDNFIICLTFE